MVPIISLSLSIVLLKASENSKRWSSIPWRRGCWISSCTAVSEFRIERESLKPFSCGATLEVPWLHRRKLMPSRKS